MNNDKNSGDYNPFYTGDNNIFSEPLSIEEMKKNGFTSCQYKSNGEYYTCLYSKDHYGCTKSICLNLDDIVIDDIIDVRNKKIDDILNTENDDPL